MRPGAIGAQQRLQHARTVHHRGRDAEAAAGTGLHRSGDGFGGQARADVALGHHALRVARHGRQDKAGEQEQAAHEAPFRRSSKRGWSHAVPLTGKGLVSDRAARRRRPRSPPPACHGYSRRVAGEDIAVEDREVGELAGLERALLALPRAATTRRGRVGARAPRRRNRLARIERGAGSRCGASTIAPSRSTG